MLFASSAARSTLLRTACLQQKRTFASALSSQVASLKGVDFMSIDQLRCVSPTASRKDSSDLIECDASCSSVLVLFLKRLVV